MLKTLKIKENSNWKQRFRAHSIRWAQIAPKNPGRGLVCSDQDGIWQLYAWNPRTGELSQRTDLPAGVVDGLLSADGETIYYLQDEGGSEIGHFVRMPYEGGLPEDITPDMAPYNA